MSDSLFSASWYRVVRLKPRLRRHAKVIRHHYRGQLWYVLQDRSSSRHFRFSPGAQQIIGLMNGRRSVGEIWEVASTRLGDDGPTQDETIRILAQLHAADMLVCDVTPDTEECFKRYERRQQSQWKTRLMSPLSLKFPLLDPERFISAWAWLVRPLFSRAAVVVWLAMITTALVLAWLNWLELTDDIAERTLEPFNLVLLVFAYPVVKALHELGHAFAAKRWGGEVHEMGIILLVLVPVPYVDCSCAAAFRDKYKRMLVGAAGVMVEMVIASLALFVWLLAEPGMVRDIAFNIALIGSVSTLLFNGNPLLRFDGYYVLADALEIPNLASRANQYLGHLVQYYLFGVRDNRSPDTAPGEPVWFVLYGISAFCYRLFIMFAVVLFVAGQFFFVGVVLALWALLTQMLVPIGKKLAFLFVNPMLAKRRSRALVVSFSLTGLVAGFIFFQPVPWWTRVEGVVTPPQDSQVRAGVDGFITQVLVADMSLVEVGEPLIETRDPLLNAKVKVLSSRLLEVNARYDMHRYRDRVKAALVKEELTAIEADLARARERLHQLIIRSPARGRFILPDSAYLAGRFIHQGNLLGYVTENLPATIRVVVGQDQIGLVREHTEKIEVRLAEQIPKIYSATIRRQVPEADNRLPSKALGAAGGGNISVHFDDSKGLQAVEDVFHMELELPVDQTPARMGGRAYVRFDHGAEPLARQWYRSLRQLFLERFSV